MDLHCNFSEEHLVEPEQLIEIEGTHYPAPPFVGVTCRSLPSLYGWWAAVVDTDLIKLILGAVETFKEVWPDLTGDNECELMIMGFHTVFSAAYNGQKKTNFGLTDFDKNIGHEVNITLPDEYIEKIQAKYKK